MARDGDDRTRRLVHGSRRPGRRKVGFCCFIASNLLWGIWGWQAQAWALIVLQVCLLLMNLRGWKKNTCMDARRRLR